MFSKISLAAPQTEVVAAGLFDWFNAQIDAATVVVQGGTFLATLIIVLAVAIRSRFQLAPTLVSVAVGAFVIWLVCFDGIATISNLFGEQIEAQAGVVPVIGSTSWA